MLLSCTCLPYTSLLRKLLAQTLPYATTPIGKIYSLRIIAITFELITEFLYPRPALHSQLKPKAQSQTNWAWGALKPTYLIY